MNETIELKYKWMHARNARSVRKKSRKKFKRFCSNAEKQVQIPFINIIICNMKSYLRHAFMQTEI